MEDKEYTAEFRFVMTFTNAVENLLDTAKRMIAGAPPDERKAAIEQQKATVIEVMQALEKRWVARMGESIPPPIPPYDPLELEQVKGEETQEFVG